MSASHQDAKTFMMKRCAYCLAEAKLEIPAGRDEILRGNALSRGMRQHRNAELNGLGVHGKDRICARCPKISVQFCISNLRYRFVE